MKINSEYKYEDFRDEVTEDNLEEYLKHCDVMFPKNTIIHKRSVQPAFKSKQEEEMWQIEEINRCINGHNGMCGSMYFWFNYCRIDIRGKGQGLPEWRTCDHEFFKLVESCGPCGQNAGKGVIAVKRRRAGFSWKAGGFAAWAAMFFLDRSIGMDSKTELDSKILFDKVRKIYNRLPDFLRTATDGGYTQSSIRFGKKDKETGRITGNESEVFSKPPTDSAYEGLGMDYWFSDEAGKKENLMTMWGLTEDCLDDESGRIGVPIIFGTAGDVDKGSNGLQEMWKNSNSYGLIKFFFPGWAGKNVDKYGNDRVRDEVLKILKIRNLKLTTEAKNYFDYVQKQPLNIDDALQLRVTGGIGHIGNIKKQQKSLDDNPRKKRVGMFRWGRKGEDPVVFDPGIGTPDLQWWIYENPDPDLTKKHYLSATDPVDHDDTGTQASGQAMYILRRGVGSSPLRIVARCFGKPRKATDFYEQGIMAQIFYHGHQNLIENNRYGMIRHYETSGYMHLLKNEPMPVNAYLKKWVPKVGARKGTNTESDFRTLALEYTDTHCDLIPDYELLEQLLRWGSENTDCAVAFLWALVHDKDLVNLKTADEQKDTNRSFKFGVKKINGKMVRYSG